jgi:alkyl hydroperoxide reductase subunit AhpF
MRNQPPAEPDPGEITSGDGLDDECRKAAESVDFGKNRSDYRFTIKAGSILKSKVLHVTIASDASWFVTYVPGGSDLASCGVAGFDVPTN